MMCSTSWSERDRRVRLRHSSNEAAEQGRVTGHGGGGAKGGGKENANRCAGHKAGKACHRRRSVYGRPRRPRDQAECFEPAVNRKALAGEVIEYPPWRLHQSGREIWLELGSKSLMPVFPNRGLAHRGICASQDAIFGIHSAVFLARAPSHVLVLAATLTR